MIHMLCHELNLDPMAVRLKNAALPGDVTAHGFRLISCGFKPALEQINEKTGYAESRCNKISCEGIGISGTSHVCGNRGFFPLI